MGTVNVLARQLAAPAGLRDQLIDPSMLPRRQAQADRLLTAEGAGHLVHDLPMRVDGRVAAHDSRPWRIDPIPVVVDAATFNWLRLAITERMEALEHVVADLYGERTLIRNRIIDPELLSAVPSYRLNMLGATPRRWLTVYGVDIAVDINGMWSVVQDLTDAPSGVGYGLLTRSVMARVTPRLLPRSGVASIARFVGTMRRALASTTAASSPRMALFSGGLDDSTFVDQSFLAVQMGINLVEGADLVVRQGRVWLRTLDGLEPVDVLYRRLDDPAVDPLEVGATGAIGVPGLMQAVRAGGVALANAHGAGVIEHGALAPFLDDAIDFLQPMTQTLGTRDTSTAPIAEVPLAPGSISPELGSAPVVLRFFAVADDDGITVLPGGTGRLLRPGDDPRFPTAATTKDVWVIGTSLAPSVGVRLPQVDFGRSVPTRAADALYWANRYAERAEALARTQRVITARLEQDPGLVGWNNGQWTETMCRVSAGIRHDQFEASPITIDDLDEQLDMLEDAASRELGSLLTEATTVREFLSVTTGRVLARLAELRAGLQYRTADVDDLDEIILSLSAFAGLWRESIVRGPSWRIGDTGRRLERCLVTVDLIDAIYGITDPTSSSEPDGLTIEVLLATCESLVAYRRRHRSDVESDAALDLLIRDDSNPRSLAAAISDLADHARNGEVAITDEFLQLTRAALLLPVDEMVPIVRTAVTETGNRVAAQWFSTPVDPQTMRMRLR